MTSKTADTDTDQPAQPAVSNGQFEQIELDTPIKRDAQTITTITLRKPRAGELRGAKLADLMQMDVTAIGQILPRISDPVLAPQEIQQMDPADTLQCGSAIAVFLLTRKMKAGAAD